MREKSQKRIRNCFEDAAQSGAHNFQLSIDFKRVKLTANKVVQLQSLTSIK